MLPVPGKPGIGMAVDLNVTAGTAEASGANDASATEATTASARVPRTSGATRVRLTLVI
jgi:hypothetical protein